MPLNLNPESATARDFAKRCVPPGEKLGAGLLISAVFHATHVRERIPVLDPFFEKPVEDRDETPREIPIAENLIQPLSNLAKENPGPISPEDLFLKLLWSPAGMSFAAERGVTEEALNTALS